MDARTMDKVTVQGMRVTGCRTGIPECRLRSAGSGVQGSGVQGSGVPGYGDWVV